MAAAAADDAGRCAPGPPVVRSPDGDQRILFRTRTGCPWRDLPGEYGNWKTAYNRHRSWSLDGTWQKILDRLRAGCDEADGPDWTLSADSTVIRAHQHAAGARHEPPAELVTGGITE
jgi:transposase